ncbi:hypothetical protein BU25DRAFT_446076 [Macroventuria anomochaeta]|uniref:Uncharacterized protein n=1 Tax=Macroventuria anomochaeta TaxID=301207 RepID=A0ACB6SCW7_9PLEO|nr:uncharacterized protein BU25DRAFT_446076 [Macroventuria anomochaeta]KAF2631154.1 hypothetical protein BU25DRAFT_446076 [Macroventuria anomochaeta]
MANWKVAPSNSEESKIEYTPFLECRKYFAVDDSGSTAGAVLRQERAFVDAFQESHANVADVMSLWGSKCDNPTTRFNVVDWRSSHGGTYPSDILKNSAALSTIRKADAWFLLTDGEIYDGDVHRLADLAYDAEILNVPLVFPITGSRGSSPGTANISVGISFFASSHDTLILFKDVQTGKIYVIAGKGCFTELGGSAAAQDLTSWNDLLVFASEVAFFSHCQKSHIKVAKSYSRAKSTGGISLVQKVEQVAPKLEDRNGAAAVIARMADTTNSDEDRKNLQEQLREAHAGNRRDYQKMIADFSGSAAEQTLSKRNQLVDAALRSLASIEAASYNADIIGRRSNRARRAEVIDSTSTIDTAKLDLEVPSCKGYCLVCCGDQEIMSICFKEANPENKEDNTSDFALNFPLAAGASEKNIDLVSSQNVCFQCALLGPNGTSIYKERLTAIIPTVQYDGSNKKYINDQLYSALTARLATSAAGIAQLFMSILQNVMQTKSWAGAGVNASQTSVDEQHEATQRRKSFQWMLNQLVQNTYTRETFNETGEWVKFQQALSWVTRDFKNHGLASFAVTYPVAGFNSLLALGQHTGAFSNDTVSRLQSARMLHSIVAKYLADLQVYLQRGSGNTGTNRERWKQKYLETIYRDFNGPLVPVDRGDASVVDDVESFKQRLSVCVAKAPSINDKAVMHRIQILLFWLLFTQRGHCTAQTFFTRISHDEHLAPAVLDLNLSVPPSEHQNILRSIFAKHDAALINPVQAASHNTLIPFANPFGASVLRCGVPSCAQPFCDIIALRPQVIVPEIVEAIRRARTKHLIDVFGILGRFERCDTGLPERTAAGRPPTSIHTNMHISIVREWVERTQDARRAIVKGGEARTEFVKDVRKRLCVEGRGNIFNAQIARNIEELLPSFFEALTAALRGEGKSGEDVACYQHNFEGNRLQGKIIWELIKELDHGKLP